MWLFTTQALANPPCALALDRAPVHLGTVAHVWQEGFEPSGVAVLGDDLVVAGGAHVLAVVSDWADPTPTVTYRTLTLPEGLESEAVATQDGRLFIGLEGGVGQSTLVEVDPTTWTLARTWVHDTRGWTDKGFRKPNKGLEGLAVGPGPVFWLGSQEDPMVHIVSEDTHRAVPHGLPCTKRCEASGMTWLPDVRIGDYAGPAVLVSSDAADTLLALKPDGTPIGAPIALPGAGQEGIALSGCTLLVAQDKDPDVASVELYRLGLPGGSETPQ